MFADKSLKRLAPITFSETGRPRVLIPDEVFQHGAELHKDFIVCYFNGRAPPYSQIQSVLNHMWGKGKKLEIHNNPITRSMIVRIPSEYLRTKILEKGAWYVGDSMFHTAKWTSSHSASTSPLATIQLWAHLTGVPLDLRHQRGLSLVAGLVGEPKETDEFTKNLVSLTLSHVKVEVNLTKDLPRVVEFERQNGEVVEVLVDYPWLPPKCSHCQELGHIAKNCLLVPIPPKADSHVAPTKYVSKESSKKSVSGTAPSSSTKKQKNLFVPVATCENKAGYVTISPAGSQQKISPTRSLPNPNLSTDSSNMPFTFSASLPPIPPFVPSVIVALPATITPSGEPYPHSPPEITQKASLKRSRSIPSLNSFPSFTPFLDTLPPETKFPLPKHIPLQNSFAILTANATSFDGSPILGESTTSS